MSTRRIALCVPTFKREALLRDCLAAAGRLLIPAGYEMQVLVADNDLAASARAVCSEVSSAFPVPLLYFLEPRRGLASIRNRLLDEAVRLGADIIGFLDDDEQPDPRWFVEHLSNMKKYHADVCTGPVKPIGQTRALPGKKARPTGSAPRHVSTNNVVFASRLVTSQGLRFDHFYNFIGGEDFDFFERSKQLNNTHIWVEEALVLEAIEQERATLRYLFYRHFTGGINSVLRYRRNRPAWRACARFSVKIIGKFCGAVVYGVGSCLGLHKAFFSTAVKKLASALGYLAGLLNIVEERYR